MLKAKKPLLTRYRIGERMRELGITQKEMITELKSRGMEVCQSNFSAYIHGKNPEPKSDKVCGLADKILTEVENGSE